MLFFYSKYFKFCGLKKNYKYLQWYCTEIWNVTVNDFENVKN